MLHIIRSDHSLCPRPLRSLFDCICPLMDFRQDINALRALAVTGVMLYHFKLPGITGGFAGVDVFFVISGFLMTGIIAKGLERGDFSLARFYASRARRLLPALIALCGVLLLAGWYWIPPSDYKELGRHVATSLTFASNFILKNETGYFGTLSQDKWLLHTWSLSVEWQFYLVYPLFLVALARLRGGLTPTRLAWALGSITAASLTFCIFYTPHDPAFSFFLLPTRLWEMSMGGLVYVLTARRQPLSNAPAIAGGGLLMIIAGFVLFDEGTLWPGSAALLPTLGCALILAAQPTLPRFLKGRSVTTLGLWSYSIYLWHWPVVVALRHFGLGHALIWDIVGAGLSVALGGLSYMLIETPLRQPRAAGHNTPALHPLLRPRAAGIVLAFLCVGLSGFAIDRNDGFDARVQASVRQIEQDVVAYTKQKPKRCTSDSFVSTATPCTTPPAKPDYLLWGDSHAGTLLSALAQAAGHAQGLAYVATCPPIAGAYLRSKKYTHTCPDFAEEALERIQSQPVGIPLVVAFRMSIYTEGYNESPDKPVGLTFIDEVQDQETPVTADSFTVRLVDTLCSLSGTGRPVYVVQPLPEFGVDVPREISRNIMTEGDAGGEVTLALSDYYARQSRVLQALSVAQKKCSIRVLDPTPYLCSDGVCYGSRNGTPLYSDDNHLGIHGVKRLIPMFRKIFAAPVNTRL